MWENKMESWLVYEVNDVCYADIPYCSVLDMKTFDTKEEAIIDMNERKQKYIEEDNDWELSDEEENCITFLDTMQEGSFDIRLIRLA